MTSRTLKTALLTIILLAFGLSIQACSAKPKIVDTWISEAPANMQFQFRSNGSVWLVTTIDTRQIWRYELESNDMLRLYDGMGRIREYHYSIQGNTLTFKDPKTDAIVETYSRQKQ